jgi:hypothetical protein
VTISAPGIGDIGVDRQGFVHHEMRAGGHGELELTVDIIEVGETDVTHVLAAVAGIAEAEGRCG